MKTKTPLSIRKVFFLILTISLGGLFLLPHPVNAGNKFQETVATATPLPDPLATPLPTPGRAPVSAWRPPLYEVPLSIGAYDHFYFTRPIAANNVNWPLSVYRYAGTNFGPNTPHTGVDIVTPEGTPVMAAADGKVVWSGYGLFYGAYDITDPYGIAVVIQHDFGYANQRLYTVYAHLSATKVSKGQQINQGDIIALSGETGLVTSAHLHFEVRMGINDFYSSYNPELWLAPPQGWGVIVGRVTNSWGNLIAEQEVRIINLDTGQEWWSKTYGTQRTINSDPYYRENFVLSDMPSGKYQVLIPYAGIWFQGFFTVQPGGVSYFRLSGKRGISVEMPGVSIPSNLPIYTPPPPTATPSE